MKRHLAIALWILTLVSLLNGCTASKKSAVTESLLRDAAIKWQKSIDSKNIDVTAGLFAIEAVGMYHANPPANGREANKKIWQSVYSDPANEHPITVEQVHISRSGDMGYTMGKWWSIRPKGNYYNGGRYVSIWKKIDGEWQMVIISANVHEDVKAERQVK